MDKLKLAYLYPELLNIYGDRGNVLCLQKRCEWRDINIEITEININEENKRLNEFDLIFIGGGQDAQQEKVAQDLMAKKNELKEAVEADTTVLAICGGYQMLGSYYQTSSGEEIQGLNILEGLYTKAPSLEKDKQSRLIGNVVAEAMVKGIEGQTLVGFENHSGRTYIPSNTNTVKPLAKIIKGYGNNGEDSFEGANYRNVFGTYLHGSLLPKNPLLADELIIRAIRKRNPKFTCLSRLDDQIELAAHNNALDLR